jgi:hypothetical protein
MAQINLMLLEASLRVGVRSEEEFEEASLLLSHPEARLPAFIFLELVIGVHDINDWWEVFLIAFVLDSLGFVCALGFARRALALAFAGTSSLATLRGRPLPRFAGGEVSAASEHARFRVELTASTDALGGISGVTKGDGWP